MHWLLIVGGIAMFISGVVLGAVRSSTPAASVVSGPTVAETVSPYLLGATLHNLRFKTWAADDAEWGRVTANDLKKEYEEIAALRKWVATLSDQKVAAQYSRWADHFEKQAHEAEKELLTGARRKEREKSRLRLEALAASIPKPPAEE